MFTCKIDSSVYIWFILDNYSFLIVFVVCSISLLNRCNKLACMTIKYLWYWILAKNGFHMKRTENDQNDIKI